MTRRDDNEAIQRPWDAGMGYNDNNIRIMTIPLSVDCLYSVKEKLFLVVKRNVGICHRQKTTRGSVLEYKK